MARTTRSIYCSGVADSCPQPAVAAGASTNVVASTRVPTRTCAVRIAAFQRRDLRPVPAACTSRTSPSTPRRPAQLGTRSTARQHPPRTTRAHARPGLASRATAPHCDPVGEERREEVEPLRQRRRHVSDNAPRYDLPKNTTTASMSRPPRQTRANVRGRLDEPSGLRVRDEQIRTRSARRCRGPWRGPGPTSASSFTRKPPSNPWIITATSTTTPRSRSPEPRIPRATPP